jgi:hypothetical protein
VRSNREEEERRGVFSLQREDKREKFRKARSGKVEQDEVHFSYYLSDLKLFLSQASNLPNFALSVVNPSLGTWYAGVFGFTSCDYRITLYLARKKNKNVTGKRKENLILLFLSLSQRNALTNALCMETVSLVRNMKKKY